jgi:hypothetical protein
LNSSTNAASTHRQSQAIDTEDWARADACYARIRDQLTLAFPDGSPVPEFMVHIYDDGTAGWRRHHETFTMPTGH